MREMIADATRDCQRAKDARVRDVAYQVEQRKRQALREKHPETPRGGGGYTAEERARRAKIFEDHDDCRAQSVGVTVVHTTWERTQRG